MRRISILILTAAILPAHAQSLSVRSYPIDKTLSLDQLIAELRDDDIVNNATDAVSAIMRYPTSPIARLFQALDDPDWQTRQVACDLLWSIRTSQDPPPQIENDMYRQTHARWAPESNAPKWRTSQYPEITQRLVEVTFEGLRDDQTPYEDGRSRALMYTNAVHGFFRMITCAQDWIPQLRTAIESDDAQQRYFAAMIAARAGVTQLIEPTCAILLPDLRDNDVEEDAKYAVWALYGFGQDLLPIIRREMPSADQQQRDLMQLLMLDIKDPPKDEAEQEQRGRRYNTVTRVVFDPVISPPQGVGWWWIRQRER